MIDISYCATWQLGKSLAIADHAFCAALLRIQAEVYNFSEENAKQDMLSEHFEATTSDRVINLLHNTFVKLTTRRLVLDAPGPLRWLCTLLIDSQYKYLDASSNQEDNLNHQIQLSWQPHLVHRVHTITSATDGTPFGEFKDPKSTDWPLVLNWLLNKIYLEGIPPYYLIPDPTWLPTESIRFFYVDSKWSSAIVDSALSIANHLDEDDKTRQAIKATLLKYMSQYIHPELKHPPQMPKYRFYLQSVAVDVFPDLVV